MACSGGPYLCLSKTCETLSWGPQELEAVWLAIWVELGRETIMAGSWMGIRFPGPETIPCLDQTQYTVEGVRE